MQLNLSLSEGSYSIPIDDIICLEANSNYTRFYLSGDRKLFSARSLKVYEALLCKSNFCRVHQSFLINKRHVSSVDEQGKIQLSNQMQIVMARRRKKQIQLEFSSEKID